MAYRQLLIPRIAAVGTSFSPLPCQGWHGYGVTNAHRVEVEVGADGHASAPLSGAAAAAPPAGAERDLSGVRVFFNAPWKLEEHMARQFESCRRITPTTAMAVFVLRPKWA
jgi:hypothetical protein